MKAFLLYRDQDFDLQQQLPAGAEAVTQDLELDTLFNAMALGDTVLFEVAKKVILCSSNEPEAIVYRRDVLRDCLKNLAVVKDIYSIAVESIQREKKDFWSILSDYPDSILHRSVDVLQMFVGMLKRLRSIAEQYSSVFDSEGFKTFFAMLRRELADDYCAIIKDHLRRLKFRGGVLISVELGKGNKAKNYVLRKPNPPEGNWISRIIEQGPRVYTFHLDPRDESGARALSELNDRGINLVANALAQSTDHILSFFTMLRTELAFYMGCLNLHTRLTEMGEPMTFPVPVGSKEREHSFSGLYDVCLALTLKRKVVSNDVNTDDKEFVIITGANQGGKSTFLRSIGVSQLMMQAGMFVPAEAFSANVCKRIFTHYKREEDTTMKSGKFDEELKRMSEIVDHLVPDSLLLFNESFAATNDREGSEIARQIVSALLEKGIKVFFVTHLYDFAHRFHDKNLTKGCFLRAERQPDGSRTFKLIEGEPLETSYGEDLYKKIFG
jgi:DNA mismatch repair ATPase MutS